VAGSPERAEKGMPEKVREAMVRFNVDENQARLLLGCSAVMVSEIVAKWKSNLRRIQKQKAADILELIRKAKNGDLEAFAQAESKLMAILRTETWEQ
jgi:Xaa-Pro aminopeptidase